MIPQVCGFQGCYLDNHRNNWRCARAVRKRPQRTGRVIRRVSLGIGTRTRPTQRCSGPIGAVGTTGAVCLWTYGPTTRTVFRVRPDVPVGQGAAPPVLRTGPGGLFGVRWGGDSAPPPHPFARCRRPPPPPPIPQCAPDRPAVCVPRRGMHWNGRTPEEEEGGGYLPGPPPPPLLPMFGADSQNFASAPSVSRGLSFKIFGPPSAGTIGGPKEEGDPSQTPPPPPQTPPSDPPFRPPLQTSPSDPPFRPPL